MSKKRKNVESVVQVFTFLYIEIANKHFHCKTINTHVMLFLQHYINTIHFWLKYNGLVIVRKTIKLIEGGHRDLTSTFFFRFFYVFSKSKKS